MTARSRARDERGVALLVVLLAVTLLTVIVVEFTYSAQVETQLAFGARNALQAEYLARSGVNLGEMLLMGDAILGKDVDGEQDLWAEPRPPVSLGDGTLELRIRDEARRVNLNDLITGGYVHDPEVAFGQRLFDVLGVDRRVLAAIYDWLDSDGSIRNPVTEPGGAEQREYEQLGFVRDVPIRVRNAPFVTFQELRLVRGVTPAVLARLEPFVTVLPPRGKLQININTAPAEILYALSPGMMAHPGVTARLIETRATAAIDGDAARKAVAGLDEALGDGRKFVAYKSDFFRIDTVGSVADVRRGVTAVVERRPVQGVLRRAPRVNRVQWRSTVTPPSLTSLPTSDFLRTLPPLGVEGG